MATGEGVSWWLVAADGGWGLRYARVGGDPLRRDRRIEWICVMLVGFDEDNNELFERVCWAL